MIQIFLLFLTSGKRSLAWKGAGGGGVLPTMSYLSIATVKGMVYQQFSLGEVIEIRQFWSRIGYHLVGN